MPNCYCYSDTTCYEIVHVISESKCNIYIDAKLEHSLCLGQSYYVQM